MLNSPALGLNIIAIPSLCPSLFCLLHTTEIYSEWILPYSSEMGVQNFSECYFAGGY